MSDSMQWILQGTITLTSPASVYDLDGFDNPAATVTHLHRLHRHVVCYIDVGSWEDWRPDAGAFPKSVLGKAYPGYPDERFLDVRRLDILEPIMAKRFQMCRNKGFDAIEPDNIDTFEADTGFPLTGADELRFVKFLIGKAHGLGLSIGQKNDGDQTAALEPIMDWALTEECFFGGFCDQFTAYATHRKRVFNTEYTNDTTPATFRNLYCKSDAKTYHYAMELKPVSLVSWRMNCAGVVTH
jgi:hypothetical protein